MPPRARQQDDAATQPDPAVTMADVAALTTPSAAEPVKLARPEPFLSEGMRHDLETVGWAVDPSSGARFELDPETDEVTVTERATPGV